jgi:hypothetical protein
MYRVIIRVIYIHCTDETIRPELERDFPDIGWVFIPDNENEKPETPFQSHFRDRLETLIETTYDNL